jgi:hypothetical protein
MEIISHRGLWKDISEKNTVEAFISSFKLGFGTETDIRDYNGRLVISHDLANDSSIPLGEFFELYKKYQSPGLLALNIKADGLQVILKKLLMKYNINNYFCFDMSTPDSIGYINQGFDVFLRISKYEDENLLFEQSKGIWLDCFDDERVIYDKFEALVIKNKVCLVSPELHGRCHKQLWEWLLPFKDKNFILCTDFPTNAKEYFFNEK